MKEGRMEGGKEGRNEGGWKEVRKEARKEGRKEDEGRIVCQKFLFPFLLRAKQSFAC